jgi:glyoxylase-like metal-dependent hydrolase (beta-lactamase superfamily II)
MQEIAPGIYHVPGKNRSRFPYCSCLYAAGSQTRVLIDAGMGANHLAPVKHAGIDWLFFTHSHMDHRLTRREITQVPAGCHPLEVPYFTDQKRFHEELGFKRSGLNLAWLYESDPRLFDLKISRFINDGDSLDLGGVTLAAILAPGHSPGHLSFFIPEYELLFSGDIDLTPFGPFYGHDVGNIRQMEASIDRLKDLGAKMVLTAHGGLFTSDIKNRFDAFRAVIEKRDRLILDRLERPKALSGLVGCGIIFRKLHDDGPFGGLNRWFEQVHIEKHLNRLSQMGMVGLDPESGNWHRIP